MQVIIMYFPGHVSGTPGTKEPLVNIPAEWEVFIDTPGNNTLPFGEVTSQTYVARPTKKQIRELKRRHRLDILLNIEASKTGWVLRRNDEIL